MKRAFAFGALLLLLLLGCDDRDALRRPSLTLARMRTQRRADAYGHTSAFPDGRVLRRPPPGTIARDAEREERPKTTRELVTLGKDAFETTCAVCHGVDGRGATYVATKLEKARPRSLHERRVRERSDDDLYAIVTHGSGMMPSYADVLGPNERWAVVAYVRALELSQRAAVRDLPPDMARELDEEAP